MFINYKILITLILFHFHFKAINLFSQFDSQSNYINIFILSENLSISILK